MEKLPKIISSVLTDELEGRMLNFNKKNVGAGIIGRFFNNVYIPLSEGDVINIKTSGTIEEIFEEPLNISDKQRLVLNKYKKFFTNELNFNFTFLIELDPL